MGWLRATASAPLPPERPMGPAVRELPSPPDQRGERFTRASFEENLAFPPLERLLSKISRLIAPMAAFLAIHHLGAKIRVETALDRSGTSQSKSRQRWSKSA